MDEEAELRVSCFSLVLSIPVIALSWVLGLKGNIFAFPLFAVGMVLMGVGYFVGPIDFEP